MLIAAHREAGNDDAARRNAALDLTVDQRLEACRALAHAIGIRAALGIERDDVVPGAHHHAAVNRDGARRRVWKDKAQRQVGREAELGHDRFEIVAVGAQAVQPDDTADRILASRYFHAFR